MNRHRPLLRAKPVQLGVSLVELMVAMAIGLVVIGAVFTSYINNTAGARQNAALTQVTSDASVVLGILRNHIAIAGYGTPTGLNATGIATGFSGVAIFGCDHGFAADNLSQTDPLTVTCAAQPASGAPNSGSSLLIRYEADADVTPTSDKDIPAPDGTTSTQARPTDCTGAGIGGATGPFIIDNRFHVDPSTTPPTLECRGNGSNSSVPLVDNVVSMQIRYGLGDTPDANGKYARVVRYATATDIGNAADAKWGRVLSVRVCVVVRSTEAVLNAPTDYVGCNGTVVTPTDRNLYRAFTSTVLINNRLSVQALNPQSGSSSGGGGSDGGGGENTTAPAAQPSTI